MGDDPQPKSHSPIRNLTGVQIIGTGSFLPENIVTNADLSSLGYDSDWITQRTGILERHHAPPEMLTSDMGAAAAEEAIKAAGIARSEIDLVLLATMTPDNLLPATATTIQDKLGLNAAAMDISAACAGFMYALVTGMQFVASGCSKYCLVIGSDVNSRVMDPADQKTFPIFGDGAGAVLLTAGSKDQGLISYTLGADGSGTNLLYRPVGGTRQPFTLNNSCNETWYLKMEGRAVFKWAIRLLESSFNDILTDSGRKVSEVDLWLLHQANIRILDAAVDNIGINRDKVVIQVDKLGNTSAGSIPLALDASLRAGKIASGDELMLCGFGAGLAWGTALFKW